MMFLTVGLGLFRYLTGSLGSVINPPPIEMVHSAQAVSVFLILRAFCQRHYGLNRRRGHL